MNARIALPRAPRSVVLAVVVLSLLGAACGGGSKKSSGSTPSTLPGAGGGAATAVTIVPAGTTWKFQPQSATVAPGSAVTWINTTDVPHNVVFTDASVKSSDLFEKGKPFTTTLAHPGSYPYICSVHPDMRGTVVVA